MSTSHRGDPHILRAKVAILDKALKWGIGLPVKVVQDGGHHTLTIAPRYPLGEGRQPRDVLQVDARPSEAAVGVARCTGARAAPYP